MTTTSNQSKFPIPSTLALLYPISATLYIWISGEQNLARIVGYGVSNLSYLLFAAGIFAGSFRIFGLKRRSYVLVVAVLVWILGIILCNL